MIWANFMRKKGHGFKSRRLVFASTLQKLKKDRSFGHKSADWPTVSGSHDLPIGFSTKNCQHNSNAVGSKNEVLARLAVQQFTIADEQRPQRHT